MKGKVLLLFFALSILLCCWAAAESLPYDAKSTIAVYSISDEKKLYTCGEWADLTVLDEDQYYSFFLEYTYNGDSSLRVDSFAVSVDNGEKWTWKPSDATPGKNSRCHIFYSNMKKIMEPGLHSATWFINDIPIHTDTFLFTNGPTLSDPIEEISWNSIFDMPTEDQIRNRAEIDDRSPYIGGWMDAAKFGRFSQYAVDFCADMLPEYTYCCPGQWYLDTRSLKDAKDGHCYGGLQLADEGFVSILSFWDVYNGDQTIRARRIYPDKGIAEDDFDGEGTGAHTLVRYNWVAGNWYRMLMACMESSVTGNTQVEQWICDLQSGEWTRLCAYDLGYSDACFKGNIAFFLENFLTRTAGDVRAMEIRNPRIFVEKSKEWQVISSAYLQASGGLAVGYSGSYAYGESNGGLYMISSGVGDWTRDGTTGKETGKGPGKQTYKLHGSSSAPY